MRYLTLVVSVAFLLMPGAAGVARTNLAQPEPRPPIVLERPIFPGVSAAMWPFVAERLEREGLWANPPPEPDPEALAEALVGSAAWNRARLLASGYAANGHSVWPGFLLSASERERLHGGLDRIAVLASTLALAWPVSEVDRVTSPYGVRERPIVGGRRHHDGVDVGVPVGTQVSAAQDGTIVKVGHGFTAGRFVEIDHGSGVLTRYLHLDRVLVRQGQKVARGDAIGRSGRTGRVTGPHLHFEVLLGEEPIDPDLFRPRSRDSVVAARGRLTGEESRTARLR